MPSSAKLAEAIARLELLAEPATQNLLRTLDQKGPMHLPDLSRTYQSSPHRIQQRLRLLQSMKLVYSPKRFPNSYAVNQYRCVQLRLSVQALVVGLPCDES